MKKPMIEALLKSSEDSNSNLRQAANFGIGLLIT